MANEPVLVCSIPGCGAKLRRSNTIGRCQEHRYAVPRAICSADGCGKRLRKDNRIGYCEDHRTATARVPVRTCAADGCDRTLRVDNESGFCKAHIEQSAAVRAYRERYYANLSQQAAERYRQRPACSVDGCANRLRSDNTTGRCAEHIFIPMDWAACAVDGCEARIKPSNTLGRCMEHRGLYWAAGAPKCSVPGCGKTLHRDNQSGLCKQHYDEANRKLNARAYYERNQDALREYARQYREVYADEHRAHASARRSRARSGLDVADRELSVAYRLAIRRDPCFYCGSPDTDHTDHYFPIAKGGTDHWWNLVRSCKRCNHAKYDRCGTAFLLLTLGG